MSKLADNIGLIQKARAYKDLFDYHFGQTEELARHDFDVYREITTVTAGYLAADNESSIRVLDIGCGQRYPNTLLFANEKNREAYGIDTDVVGPGIAKYIRMIGRNGLERSVKSALRELLFDRSYYKALNKYSGKTLHKNKLTINNAEAGNLPFQNNFFDLVVSNAVFEHIEDVPSALKEINRICKPDAVYYIVIHLYCSLSGGHNMRWAFPEKSIPDDVPPWDHLRGNEFPTHIYLNKLQETEYRAIFEQYTEILEWNDGPNEGEELLTPDIALELSEYSREELLKRYVTVICRPKIDRFTR